MDTERINITIPKHLVVELNELTSPRKRSKFISEAIQQKIEQEKKQRLTAILTEGYQNRCQENLDVLNDFQSADLEGWDDY